MYQDKVDGHLENIQNCVAIADIIIYGFDENGLDHDKTVRKVMEKVKSVGMRFNPTKCQFQKDQIIFFQACTYKTGCCS